MASCHFYFLGTFNVMPFCLIESKLTRSSWSLCIIIKIVAWLTPIQFCSESHNKRLIRNKRSKHTPLPLAVWYEKHLRLDSFYIINFEWKFPFFSSSIHFTNLSLCIPSFYTVPHYTLYEKHFHSYLFIRWIMEWTNASCL